MAPGLIPAGSFFVMLCQSALDVDFTYDFDPFSLPDEKIPRQERSVYSLH